MEPWRICRPVVADLHHLDEVQDLDPHFREKPDPDLQPHSTPVVDSGSGSSFKYKYILMLLKDTVPYGTGTFNAVHRYKPIWYILCEVP
jgi:hypothetical protein